MYEYKVLRSKHVPALIMECLNGQAADRWEHYSSLPINPGFIELYFRRWKKQEPEKQG